MFKPSVLYVNNIYLIFSYYSEDTAIARRKCAHAQYTSDLETDQEARKKKKFPKKLTSSSSSSSSESLELSSKGFKIGKQT